VRLGEVDKAHAAIDYFMGHRRPAHWNHWAEVVYRDPEANRFVGDAPHGWVGSDFLRSVRNLFVYEKADHKGLVLAAGIKSEWLDLGVAISNLPTYFGTISLSAKRGAGENADTVVYEIDGSAKTALQLCVGNLGGGKDLRVLVNETEVEVNQGMVSIADLPARVDVTLV